MRVKKIDSLSLFVTSEFRDSSWIKQLCAKIPTVWVTDDPLPPGHFGTFYGAMPLRTEDYLAGPKPRPYVHELYHLHEHTHVRTIIYSALWAWIEFAENAIKSEVESSVCSEIEVYLRILGVRNKAFDHPIWVDRFIDRDQLLDFAPTIVQSRMDKIRTERERAMTSPKSTDFLELQVHNYQQQNITWCSIWEQPVGYGPYAKWPAFAVVHEHMEKLAKGLITDVEHIAWIEMMHPTQRDVSDYARFRSDKVGGLNIERDLYVTPFFRQAIAFEHVYNRSNEVYGNAKLSTKGARDGNYPVLT